LTSRDQPDPERPGGVERAHDWGLLLWTLFRRPRLFPLAITLAIYGFHFRQVIALRVG